jgi:hypothetical protein
LQATLAVGRNRVPLSALGFSGEVPTLVIDQWDFDDRLKGVAFRQKSAGIMPNCLKSCSQERQFGRQECGKRILVSTDGVDVCRGSYGESGFNMAFGIKGAFHPGVEEMIRKALTEVRGMTQVCDS